MSPSEPRDIAPIALVTGAGVRVGRAIASTLAASGYRVWLHHHRSADAANELRSVLAREGNHEPLPMIAADLLDEAARLRMMAEILDHDGPAAGRLDLLVNNAASFERGSFGSRTDSDLRRVLELNLVAPLSLCRAATPALQASRGSIVNILDIAAVHPWPEYLDHCTAKAALLAATRGLAVELAPVRVNAVAPGTVDWPSGLSETTQREIVQQIPLGRIGTPQDVADAVLFFARSPHVSGQILSVDGGRLAAAGGRRP